MEWLTKCCDAAERRFTAAFDYLQAHPRAGYLVVLGLFGVELVGLLLQQKWATEAIGHRRAMLWQRWLGPSGYRKLLLAVTLTGIAATIYLYLLTT